MEKVLFEGTEEHSDIDTEEEDLSKIDTEERKIEDVN